MPEQKQPSLVFVGGFLGAGKTTLILKAADLLKRRGRRVAIITNDQDSGLVDTQQSLAQNVLAREVAGGCFCCRFSDLIEASETLAKYEPDIIFAEPVGSCIDLSATILQPLKAFYSERFHLTPLTVLIDPITAERVGRGELDTDVEYLFSKQIAEADLICLSKIDCSFEPTSLQFPVDFRLSARTGEGVEEWLDEVLGGRRVPGAHLLEVDYRQYAHAEAALGWVNLHAEIRTAEPVAPAMLCGPLVDQLSGLLDAAGISIAHLKMFDQGGSGWIKVSLSANGRQPIPEGDLLAEPVHHHQLAINLRAVADPDQLRNFVERVVSEISGAVSILHFRSFRPDEPRPEHRFGTVVSTVQRQ